MHARGMSTNHMQIELRLSLNSTRVPLPFPYHKSIYLFFLCMLQNHLQAPLWDHLLLKTHFNATKRGTLIYKLYIEKEAK